MEDDRGSDVGLPTLTIVHHYSLCHDRGKAYNLVVIQVATPYIPMCHLHLDRCELGGIRAQIIILLPPNFNLGLEEEYKECVYVHACMQPEGSEAT